MGLFRWMGVFAGYPWLALFPITLFFLLGFKAHSRVVSVIALVWLLYGGYEMLMNLRVLCSGNCDVRMDLLIIYPILLLASIIALVIAIPKIFFAHR